MRAPHRIAGTALASAIALAVPALAQPLDGAPADPRFRYSTAMPEGVAAPYEVKTRLGSGPIDLLEAALPA